MKRNYLIYKRKCGKKIGNIGDTMAVPPGHRCPVHVFQVKVLGKEDLFHLEGNVVVRAEERGGVLRVLEEDDVV